MYVVVSMHAPYSLTRSSQGYNSVYSTDSAEESEQERTKKTVLGRLARKRFEAMLRGLTGKRGELARCMTFSLEHAEAAREVGTWFILSFSESHRRPLGFRYHHLLFVGGWHSSPTQDRTPSPHL